MPAAVFFWGGGENDSPLSGGVIVMLVLAFLVVVPAITGLVLRLRDTRRGRTGSDVKPVKEPPPKSGRSYSWDASEPFDWRAASTPRDWMIVGAFAIGIVVLLLVVQV